MASSRGKPDPERPGKKWRADIETALAAGEIKAYHHGDLRTALVAAAAAILETEGFEALTLRGVARAAGVSRQAPYHHFAGLAGLLAAVAAKGFRELGAAMETRIARETCPKLRLTAAGVGYVAFAARNPALFKLMFGGSKATFPPDEELSTAREGARDMLRGAIAGLDPAPDQPPDVQERRGLAAWAVVHGLAELVTKGVVKIEDYGTDDIDAFTRDVLLDGRVVF